MLSFSLDMYPEWNSGSYSSSIFTFLRKLYTIFIVIIQIYIPTNSAQVFSFLHLLANICYLSFFFFGDSPSDRCEVLSLCGFGLYFHDD